MITLTEAQHQQISSAGSVKLDATVVAEIAGTKAVHVKDGSPFGKTIYEPTTTTISVTLSFRNWQSSDGKVQRTYITTDAGAKTWVSASALTLTGVRLEALEAALAAWLDRDADATDDAAGGMLEWLAGKSEAEQRLLLS